VLNYAKHIAATCLLTVIGATQAATEPAAPAATPADIIAASCSGCHAPNGEGRWFRISDQRKTPEGWQMTLARMQMVHQAQITDPSGGDSQQALRTLVKYFADTQGLAPAESAPYRYILEQDLNTIETHESEQFRSMCARCHTGARVGLQRRTEEEWRNLVHFHLGQFPTAEYQMMGRDRDWLGIALNDVLPDLAERFPLQSEAWEQWLAAAKPALEGSWRVVGYMPGRGDFSGQMTASAKGDDRYSLDFSGQFADGESLTGTGQAIVYTGYEWRGGLTLGDEHYRQVLAASADGAELSGRMFQRDHDEWGLRMHAVRDAGKPALLAVQPAALQAEGETELHLAGSNLAGDIDLGPGLKVVEVLSRDGGDIRVRVAADKSAATGPRAVKVGAAGMANALTVYSTIDRIAVEPGYAVGRVGGNGGAEPVVQAIFDAVAWNNGPDGAAGTDDDLRIGPVAASWTVAPYTEQAASDQDVKFAGKMDMDTGVFTPAGAGPNPERKYQTNNAGDLKVVASVDRDGKTLQGEGHLTVTVQRWNNPPIR
jgi:quinohemoprotein amine dehydrogenase